MAEGGDNQIECGFCVGKLGDLEDSRSLPCGHIHCLRCLTGSFEVSRIVRCPFCRYVHIALLITTHAVLLVDIFETTANYFVILQRGL